MNLRDAIFSANLRELQAALIAQPELANKEISLPDNPTTAHPLHRICDGVFSGTYSEDIAMEMAEILLSHGASINPVVDYLKDSPLTTACSLNCDRLALLYIKEGADITHQGCSGGTALHWASWCGRDVVVEELVKLKPGINQLCVEFKSTPLYWAIHGYRFSKDNRHHQINCARILLKHGADPSIPNLNGTKAVELLEESDLEFRALFNVA